MYRFDHLEKLLLVENSGFARGMIETRLIVWR
jgi:hypothetical protein